MTAFEEAIDRQLAVAKRDFEDQLAGWRPGAAPRAMVKIPDRIQWRADLRALIAIIDKGGTIVTSRGPVPVIADMLTTCCACGRLGLATRYDDRGALIAHPGSAWECRSEVTP